MRGDASGAVERWIDDDMKHKRCVIVLTGEETARRPSVRYEIERAWNDQRGLFGIHIRSLRCPREIRASLLKICSGMATGCVSSPRIGSSRVHWPQFSVQGNTATLSAAQLAMLIEGIEGAH